MSSKSVLLLTFSWAIYLVILLSCVRANFTVDSQQCSDKWRSLSTCLSFVSGETKSPAATCCTNLREQVNTTKKCLCLLVKDRDDPNLGYKINATLALSLPSTCHAAANVSECPEILHLAPHSPDAQVFEQFAANSNNSGSVVAANPSSSSSSNASSEKQLIAQASIIGCIISALTVGL